MYNGSTSHPQTLMRLKILGHFCASRAGGPVSLQRFL
jgi:hypothetical protein